MILKQIEYFPVGDVTIKESLFFFQPKPNTIIILYHTRAEMGLRMVVVVVLAQGKWRTEAACSQRERERERERERGDQCSILLS